MNVPTSPEEQRYTTVSATDMSAVVVGPGYNLGRWLSGGAQAEWPATGTPVGTLSFQGSNDSDDGLDGTWRPTVATVPTQPAGSANGTLVDLSALPWAWVRSVYTPASGGVGAFLRVVFFGKGRAYE